MKKKVTIKDLAKLSGFSVATVSRVINDNGRFSEETRKRVLDLIQQTGYQMNYSAKSLRMKKSFTIGVLVPDISNFFFGEVVQKIEEILFDKGYSTIICNTARNNKKESAYLQMLEGKGVDGIIVISGAEDFSFEETDAEKNIPYVCIDREPKEKKNTIFISSNHYQGAFDATELLISAGCKSPLIVMHSRKSPSALGREDGFFDALKKNNITASRTHNKLELNIYHSDFKNQVIEYFDLHKEIDGIFAINDQIALELIFLLKRKGVQLPDDIKIIGFDNTPQGKYSVPSLTSIWQNSSEIACLAVKNLLACINNPNNSNVGKSFIVPVEKVIRDSTM
ncbi:LacI family transcriptional regulator [Listeria seeligeri]|uniref:LacI family DNA-binding transcriptional regulator n=2 Tax=Listeria seeligeri TaxID=1640 RepID=UPI00162A8B47|nr:LacI family DNA-binding transcriptional regulator [Listeria seeligeri]MBC1727335.1 LacI family transcriptional regulator [Listeria seeligeri]MBC1734920.1 LacI family transcriptional regulator [Listeria seeligeri]MBF2366517.1 LacI family DNA-binding transcriptional regulator [Listeria seeligeri]MBF2540141.1 LacI family DNA-binding transcriptional regulator [Listeria seeligeri]MBF2586954.1 LacI family DNA-binding transcriptional regulator [Listeria seeligeri]